jgi:serine/threonine-protein kinase ATR
MAVIKSGMGLARQVESAVWLRAISQLVSRVDLTGELGTIVFDLMILAFREYPEATLWRCSQIARGSRSERFDEFWKKAQAVAKPRDVKTRFDAIADAFVAFCMKETAARGHARLQQVYPELRKTILRTKILPPFHPWLTGVGEAKVHVADVEDGFRVFNSLQAPRRVTLRLSNGEPRKVLVKSDDDLRKDERLMEFAGFVNLVFRVDRRCRLRDLKLQTFTVVCLNESVGLIEWVDGTTALHDVVYRAWEAAGLDPSSARQPHTGATPEEKLQHYQKTVAALPPVLGDWFWSTMPNAAEWFASRVRYINSVSAWSMVGYVLGLGDRHAENVLLQEKTGVCVHVDFACMFDKGRTLGVPEIVPFRMTPNIVHGMGILEWHGSCVSACDIILETFRGKRAKLLTVLSPFASDPLIEWSRNSRESANQVAKKMLAEVGARLATDASASDDCAQTLIERASDERNLALMYWGWQPFL